MGNQIIQKLCKISCFYKSNFFFLLFNFFIFKSGADDFIPLFAYVLLKSRVPNIIAESNFMYSFIDQYSTGEKTGYMLVTLQTCIEFLTKLELSQIDESAKKMVQEVRTRRESLKARVRAPSGMSLEALQQFISNQQQQYLEKQNWFHPNISKEESTFILQVQI